VEINTNTNILPERHIADFAVVYGIIGLIGFDQATVRENRTTENV
jgi:hypothetical protein